MAADLVQIEQRLSSVEIAFGQVQKKLGITSSPLNWVEEVSGSLADIPEEDYQKFVGCCRAVRNGDSISAPEEPGLCIEDRTL